MCPEINVSINASGAIEDSRKVNKALGSIAKKGRSLIGSVFTPLNTAIAGIGGAAALVGVTRITDAYTVMASQLEYATGSTNDAAEAEEQLYQISKKTGTSMKDNADSLVKMQQAQKLTGLTMDNNIAVIGALNGLMIKTGTTGVQASAAMLQLSQALTSGKLSGDEFRSMAENAPGVLNEMSKAMGIAREDLKAMSTAGELTSERLGKALLSIAESGTVSFEELPKTVAKGWNSVVLAFSAAWNKIDDETGIMSYLHNALEDLATWIEDNTYRFSSWIEDMMTAIQTSWPAIKSSIGELWDRMVAFMDGIGDKTPSLVQNISTIAGALSTLVGWLAKAVEGYKFLLDAYTSWKGVSGAKQDARDQTSFNIAGGVAAGHSFAAIGDALGMTPAEVAQNYQTTINVTTPADKNITRDMTNIQNRQAEQI